MSGMSSQSSAQNRARNESKKKKDFFLVSLPYSSNILSPPSSPTRPGSPILIGSSSEGSPMVEHRAPLWACEESTTSNHCRVVSINMLPDDAILEIFDSYLHVCRYRVRERAWQSLVHVCRRWRHIVFGSPRRLNLQLTCTGRTPTRDRLDIWPALPLNIDVDEYDYEPIRSVDDIVAGLERTDRVRKIDIANVPISNLLAAMQQPFPEVTYMRLWPTDDKVPVVPDSFLGGNAPRLENITWSSIPFPGLPKLLLSATQLYTLHLHSIPHCGYFSPEAMVTVLSTLNSLRYLWLSFESPRSCPDLASRRPPPLTRYVLPGFTHLRFRGVSEYLEDLVACIDAPHLSVLDIAFFYDIDFDTPQFMQFISRTPMSRDPETAQITLRDYGASFSSYASRYIGREFKIEISCKGLDWQLSSLGQVCTPCLRPLSMLESLNFSVESGSQPGRKDDIEDGLWLELLQAFPTVKNLHLSEGVAPLIVPALQELVGDRTTEVLPALENITLGGHESSGPVQEGMGKFVAARQVVGHPIAVSPWV